MAIKRHEAVTLANQAFYDAFASQDAEAMAELWAKEAPVACVHPGWQPLFGRESVLESWRAILSHGGEGRPLCLEPKVQMHGDTAIVVCFESMGSYLLAATNVFVLEGDAWRLVLHQASAMAESGDEDEAFEIDDDDDEFEDEIGGDYPPPSRQLH